MTDKRFMLSTKFINTVLNNYFGMPTQDYTDTSIYAGLGIEFDENSFSFTKEPVCQWFTINDDPITFSEPNNGTIRNAKAIEWEKAEVDWTQNGETIKYIGLYYKYQIDNFDYNPKYELIAVLPLNPEEKVLNGEKLVLNPGAIQISLMNR